MQPASTFASLLWKALPGNQILRVIELKPGNLSTLSLNCVSYLISKRSRLNPGCENLICDTTVKAPWISCCCGRKLSPAFLTLTWITNKLLKAKKICNISCKLFIAKNKFAFWNAETASAMSHADLLSVRHYCSRLQNGDIQESSRWKCSETFWRALKIVERLSTVRPGFSKRRRSATTTASTCSSPLRISLLWLLH